MENILLFDRYINGARECCVYRNIVIYTIKRMLLLVFVIFRLSVWFVYFFFFVLFGFKQAIHNINTFGTCIRQNRCSLNWSAWHNTIDVCLWIVEGRRRRNGIGNTTIRIAAVYSNADVFSCWCERRFAWVCVLCGCCLLYYLWCAVSWNGCCREQTFGVHRRFLHNSDFFSIHSFIIGNEHETRQNL